VLSKQGEPLQYKEQFIKLNKKAYSRAELIASVFQLDEYTKQKLIPYFDEDCKEISLKTLKFKKSASERLFATKVNKAACN
ncbi:hypothetical protein M8834_35015, partial [Pseudomonas aeruginosa]|uniref:hypothetical protein n=1 Tax=Pseudomonas aeruginosa TaxID=287 RepID=UPI0020226C07